MHDRTFSSLDTRTSTTKCIHGPKYRRGLGTIWKSVMTISVGFSSSSSGYNTKPIKYYRTFEWG